MLVANELHRKGMAQLIEALAVAEDQRLSLHVVGRRASALPAAAGAVRVGGRVHHHGPSDDVGWQLAERT